ncbi:uncharacterized protein LOC119076414 [Bradysia coprophila]|uniref:uncharacterized protein LOC119076414 n=1 Tax=Bradysia coprophila TaxID=38358 RepID=UPI00187DA3D5|nr:uncharacterized protein LOC119076414 [Bradysia coprophila]
MAEGTYEYECNRAELLGIDPPNRADFEAALKVQQEEMEKELANEVETTEEQLNNTSGKFDELNSILSVTQQRLNKFKTACGSLTNLLKIRGNQKTDMPDSLHPTTSNDESESANSGDQSTHTDAPLDSSETMQPQSSKGNANSMQQKMSCQFDKLDAMINKAENAQYSMSHQNKQMKSFLK